MKGKSYYFSFDTKNYSIVNNMKEVDMLFC